MGADRTWTRRRRTMNDTKSQGLEGVVAATTRLSSVDGEAGELLIAGFPVEELAPRATFEETTWLLWHGDLPTAEELEAFRRRLAGRRVLPAATLDLLRAAARRRVPVMDALRMAAGSLSLVAGAGEDPREDGVILVSAFPTIVAAYWRLLKGEEPLPPREDLGHAASFLYMLSGEEPAAERARGLETYRNTVSDHGLNASTFTARRLVSTRPHRLSAITGAVAAWQGPLPGRPPGRGLGVAVD